MAVFSQEQLDNAKEAFDAGDRAPWVQLVELLRPQVQNRAEKLLHRYQDAEDVTQNFLLKLCRNTPKKFETPDKVEAFANVSAQNMARDIIKREKRNKAGLIENDSLACAVDLKAFEPYQILAGQELESAITTNLKDKDRNIYTGIIAGDSNEKIAKEAGIHVRTLRRRRQTILNIVKQFVNGERTR